jgi:DNA-binding transcriptional regulator YdaS (Cro superfamily)
MQLGFLLDRAKKCTGSDSATAKALDVSPQRVSDWRNETRPCPAEVQVRICLLAELSDKEIAAHVIERAKACAGKTWRGSSMRKRRRLAMQV